MIESAHATAFRDIPVARRREMFEQLRPFMSDAERTASPDDPHVLAKLVRRAEERRAERAAARGGPDADARHRSRPPRRPTPRDAIDPRDLMLQTTASWTLWHTIHLDQLGLVLLHRRRRLARLAGPARLGRRHVRARVRRDRRRLAAGATTAAAVARRRQRLRRRRLRRRLRRRRGSAAADSTAAERLAASTSGR